MKFTILGLTTLLLILFLGTSDPAFAQRRPGGGPPAGTSRGGPPAGIPAGAGIDGGLSTASKRSGGRSDQGLGTASENSDGRSNAGLDRARMGGTFPSDDNINRYRGIARRLGTTPEALRERFLSASADNPDLKFGLFVAANVLAQNLGTRYPKVTTEAILLGLQNGDNLGQTLRMLGVGEFEVKEAPRAAERLIKESQKQN